MYEAAFNQLDVAAAAAAWPTVDQRALGRAFDRVERQTLDFEQCTVALSEMNATARCQGTLSYVPRVGRASARSETHTWTFRLQGANESWRIVGMSAE